MWTLLCHPEALAEGSDISAETKVKILRLRSE